MPDSENIDQEKKNDDGRKLPPWLEKTGRIFALIIAGVVAGGYLRGCLIDTGAPIIGLQTVAAAKATQEKNEQTHRELLQSQTEMKTSVDAAKENSDKTFRALPRKWRERVTD